MKKNSENRKRSKLTVLLTTMIICVLLLSATTYAWFKLTNSPSVNELTLQAGTEGNLKICATENGEYADTLDLSTTLNNSCLRPLTTTDGAAFYKPVYSSEGKVTAVESSPVADLTAIANKDEAHGGYLVQTTFYLKATTSETKNIGIKLAGAGSSTSSTTYTQVANDSTGEAAASIRVSFKVGSTVSVLEPNATTTVTNSDATQYAMSGWTSLATVKQDSSCKFQNAAATAYDQSVSSEIFTMSTNAAVPVTMTIWIEGADKDCINDIATNVVKTRIQFISTDLD